MMNTSRETQSRGYEVVVMKDGHSTFDAQDGTQTVDELIEQYNDSLSAVAVIQPSTEIQF
ncbi:MAG TPA: hypothetical protein VHL11_01480 [Phototrophicaceae bacterium]|jgi:hypothetical protein|nr:hypothetical protein [Phototrophicaceae bacterium]